MGISGMRTGFSVREMLSRSIINFDEHCVARLRGQCLVGAMSIRGLLLFIGVSLSPLPATADDAKSVGEQFQTWLDLSRSERPPLEEQAFAKAALAKREATVANRLLWEDLCEARRSEVEQEMKKEEIAQGDAVLRWKSKTFGEKPEQGRSLYISMHGGGGTRPEVNDQQWRNQIKLYQPEEGIYLAPRAPTDAWNLWHKAHIDGLFDRLIENHVMLAEVDPNKVYFMGYSAGGDGVYQLAPRMADRLAAAAMMAGHPNDAKPDGLRNIGFTLHMGGKDRAYKRNQVAREWKEKLAELQKEDPQGYRHEAVIHEEKGHWMDREDAVAVPWMAQCTRNPHPKKVVWLQDDVTHERFYWLAMPKDEASKGQRVVASIADQVIQIDEVHEVETLTVLLADAMLDLDQEFRVVWQGRSVFEGKVDRTIAALARSLGARPDPTLLYVASVTLDLDSR